MTELLESIPDADTPYSRNQQNRALADELRANPGLWAKYPHPVAVPRNLRYRIANGKDSAFGPGFTAEVRAGEVFISYQPEQDNA